MVNLHNKLPEVFISQMSDFLRFSPTGDNAQHWSFLWSENRLLIYLDAVRAKHVMNQNNFASLLSLGTVLEIAKIVASQHSMNADITLNELKDFSGVVATISFYGDNSISQDLLMDQIKIRATNRNTYRKCSFSKERFETLKKDASALSVQLHHCETPDSDLRRFIIDCEKYIWTNRDAFMNTTQWIRYSDTEILEKKDGFPLSNIKLTKLDGMAVKLFRKSHRLWRGMYSLGLKVKVASDAKSMIDNTGCLLAVSISSAKPESIVNSGAAIYRSWLHLTSWGYSCQPLTLASSFPMILEKDGYLTNCSEDFQNKFKSAKEILSRNFHLDSDQTITWMIRVGEAESLKESDRTPRREIEDFFKI